MSLIIGVSGKAHSGKDTTADIILTTLNAEKVALADEIKRTAKRWWGFSDLQLWGPSEYRNERPPGNPDGPTARDACQKIGTDVARLIDRNVWVNYLFGVVNHLQTEMHGRYVAYNQKQGTYIVNGVQLDAPDVVVVPDVRYQNEMDAIRAKGGILIRIKRPGGKQDNHPSETEQDAIPDSSFHYVIENRQGLDELRERVCDILRDMSLL